MLYAKMMLVASSWSKNDAFIISPPSSRPSLLLNLLIRFFIIYGLMSTHLPNHIRAPFAKAIGVTNDRARPQTRASWLLGQCLFSLSTLPSEQVKTSELCFDQVMK